MHPKQHKDKNNVLQCFWIQTIFKHMLWKEWSRFSTEMSPIVLAQSSRLLFTSEKASSIKGFETSVLQEKLDYLRILYLKTKKGIQIVPLYCIFKHVQCHCMFYLLHIFRFCSFSWRQPMVLEVTVFLYGCMNKCMISMIAVVYYVGWL